MKICKMAQMAALGGLGEDIDTISTTHFTDVDYYTVLWYLSWNFLKLEKNRKKHAGTG